MRQVRQAALALALLAPGLALAQAAPLNCTVAPLYEVALAAPVAGVVAEVLVRPGDHVSAGDLIARLDSGLAEADLALARQEAGFTGEIEAARITLASLEAKRDRMRDALAQQAISQNDFDDLERDVALARVAVARQEQALAMARIRAEQAALFVARHDIISPAGGIIGEGLISVGESTAGRPVAALYVTDQLLVEVFVPLPQLAQIRDAAPVSAIGAEGGSPVLLTLDHVAAKADLSSNTVSVFYIAPGDSDLRPGARCRVEF